MRRTAGAWLRERIRVRRTAHGLFMMLAFGYVLGAGISLWIVPLFGGAPWMILLAGTLLIGTWVVVFLRDKELNPDNWSIQHMEKGAAAEETIGQAIEYALTREGCAVAHHVNSIARYGDIDHLVATPVGLWVIETKSSRIPNSGFHKALRQINANVEAVKRWAPETYVQGCLVFGGESNVPSKRRYTVEGTSIRCFSDIAELTRQLKAEAGSEIRETALSQKVRDLAKSDAVS